MEEQIIISNADVENDYQQSYCDACSIMGFDDLSNLV
jgi:hypothetical protein